MDKAQKLARQREYRKANGNACTKKYEKTPRGFLMRTYRNMESRVLGIQWRKAHLYEGKDLLSRDQFYDWSTTSDDFWSLWKAWVKSGYDRKLTPSVDRINSKDGYHLSNMEWVTHSENSRRGSLSRFRKADHANAGRATT